MDEKEKQLDQAREEVRDPERLTKEQSPAAEGQDSTPEEKEKTTPQAEAYYTIRSLVGVLVVLVLVFTFLGRLILVDGISMEPTLIDGEMMVVRSLGYTLEQGDIVVLAKEGFHNGDAIVKRVIALGGQTVEIDYDAGVVLVDGVVLDEPYIKEYMVQQPYQTITSVTVPEGCIFVMGDNRNNSDDSRDELLGVVDERLVIGEAILVLFPFNRIQVL